MKKFNMIKRILVSVLLTGLYTGSASAYDVDEKLSIEGSLTGVYQYAVYDKGDEEDRGRGAFVMDLGLNFRPSSHDEIHVLLSYAAGNALNPFVPFTVVPYADNLEDDLQNINGRNRNNLLLAWYKRTVAWSESASLGITWGIIDSVPYIGENAFASDEISQFMNEAFVLHQTLVLPSYDIGAVAELELSNFTIRAVGMNTINQYELSYNFYALQVGYRLDTAIGEGSYRIFSFATTEQFLSWDMTSLANLDGHGFSFDQRLGTIFGAFLRFAWQKDDAIVNYDQFYSGGVNVNGSLWGRASDELGLAFAYEKGADQSEFDDLQVAEAYVKMQVIERIDLTLDVQYIDQTRKDGQHDAGTVYGFRINSFF